MSVQSKVKYQKDFNKTTLGFWLFLMTDCVLFAAIFATYAVLRGGTAGGPSGNDLFNLDFVFVQTLLLLASSLTSGLILAGVRMAHKKFIMAMLLTTFVLGAGFLGMELYEFNTILSEGYSWQTSAFLSAYFTLVGMHGIHIAIGLLWIGVLCYYLFNKGITNSFSKRATLFSMFWHFLDIIWIFIYTFVYLIGAFV